MESQPRRSSSRHSDALRPRSRGRGEEDELVQLVEASGGVGGPFVEWLVRRHGENLPQHARSPRQRRLKRSATRKAASCIGLQEFGDLNRWATVLKTSSAYPIVVRRLRSEVLARSMSDAIVLDGKERGIIPPTPTSAFWGRAKQLRDICARTTSLRANVDNYNMSYRLLHSPSMHVQESPWDRQRRLASFWMVFHGRAWDKARAAPPGDSPRRGEGHASTQKAPTARIPGRLPSGVVNLQGWLVSGKEVQKSASLPCLVGGRPSPSHHQMTSSSCGLRPCSPGEGEVETKAKSHGLPPIHGGRRRYLQECDARQNVPNPLAFATGHSDRLTASGRALADCDLLAVAGMLPGLERVKEVSLHDNALLTDLGLAPFLRRLSELPSLQQVREIDLGGCTRAGLATQTCAVQLVQIAKGLQKLDLSSMQLATRFQLPLCEAIGGHPSLEKVRLADTGIGGPRARECVDALLRSAKVHTLDLGWNCFPAEVFQCLGESVASVATLRHLCLDNCAAALAEESTPISFFLERLVGNRSLTKLDIAMNRIDFCAALIIEDSLGNNTSLLELNLAQNPLGMIGVRSIMRLLSSGKSGLGHFRMDECFSGHADESGDSAGSMMFSATNPTRKYKLDLMKPHHRSMLRMLYKTADKFGIPPDNTFQKVTYTKGSWSHAPKDSAGIWQVPCIGTVAFKFSIEALLQSAFAGVGDADFSLFLRRHFEVMRSRPEERKAVPMFALWKRLCGSDIEQNVFLCVLARDFNLSISQLRYMAESSPSIMAETYTRLLPCVYTEDPSCLPMYLCQMSCRNFNDLLYITGKMRSLLELNVDNPTGHYKLNLQNRGDHAVAERLLLLDRWEAMVDHRHKRADTSHMGNGSHIRNATFQGRALHLSYASIDEWSLQELGELEFDYSSTQKPLQGTPALDDSLWEDLLIRLHRSTCEPADKILVLRHISNQFFLTSMHMRQLTGYFRTEGQRVDACVVLFMRIVDMHNDKIFRVRFTNQDEVRALLERIGYAGFFPYLQPENSVFSLDLRYYDQRLCAAMYVQLSLAEKASNIVKPVYIYPDGKIDPLALGVPRSWADLNKLPREGNFSGSYICSPDDRKFETRKKLAEEYGYYKIQITVEEVMWWTGLAEPPPDVITFLEFLIGNVTSIQATFMKIDGAGGNGQISRTEFADGMKVLGCKKFQGKHPVTGKDEKERINEVFNYLDPGGQGTISVEEFKILDQLWKEFQLSIREFVHFLHLSFGEDLQDAWRELDVDGDGGMSFEEFQTGCTSIGYFGPAAVVYAVLDGDGGGAIAWDEFKVLENYKSNIHQVATGA